MTIAMRLRDLGEYAAGAVCLTLLTLLWLTDLTERRRRRKLRKFMPRCRTCKALSKPCDEERAWVLANRHHDQHPTHKISVTPVRA